MKKYALWFVFLAGALAQQDLSSKVFLFPKEGATAHVILNPETAKPLDKLTVCARSYTELNREHPLFSLALKASGKDNMFLIFPRPPNACSVYINQEEIRIKIDTEVLDWKHTCVSWDSETGVIELWVNGKLYPRRVSNKGFTIPVPYSIILGQEQDSFGGGFDAKQSFVGELSDVHMWDYVLTPENIQKAWNNDFSGSLISWTSLKYEAKGNALVLPKRQCRYLGSECPIHDSC
ncbi:C-reactive protein-like [Spea bombifrons]|uniref:C-reactive protein-like n=1 Tax=Spea bombifrons TaxID=233779 RepID=UPI00234926B2|nr:C-reactive protein-like [Spea bombifrons]